MPREDEIGCLWVKEKNGTKYMTGKIDGKQVVVFRNKKKNDRQPDFRVLTAHPRNEQTVTEPQITDADIPF